MPTSSWARRIVVRSELHAALHTPACGRNVVGQFRTNGALTVPVTPVECVHWKQRGKDAELFQGIDLVLAQELSVDQDWTTIIGAVFVRRGLDCRNQLVKRFE